MLNIAISGINAIDSPGPGIPVIRSLRECSDLKFRIIGLCYDTLEPGIYMHELVDKSYMLPLPSKGSSELMARIEQIHKAEKLDMIIPLFDAELHNFIKIADDLRSRFNIRTCLPTQEQFESRQKFNLPEFATSAGISTPPTHNIRNAAELEQVENSAYPFLLKGKYYEAITVQTREHARSAFHHLASRWGLPVIMQQRVYGEEVNLTGLGDGQGTLLGAVAMKKQYVTDKGKAWSGVSIADPKLMDLAKKMVRISQWRGGFELEVIRTDKGEYQLIEINPRFPAWIYLAVACGQNHPELMVKMAMGQPVGASTEYQVGKMFVRYSYDMIIDLKEFETISTRGEL